MEQSVPTVGAPVASASDSNTTEKIADIVVKVAYLIAGIVLAFKLIKYLRRKIHAWYLQCNFHCTEEEDMGSEVEGLHDIDCLEMDEDLNRMRRILRYDPDAVERPQVKTSCWVTAEDRMHGQIFENSPTRPLHDAVASGHLKCVMLMVESGASLNRKSPEHCPEGLTPLEVACKTKRYMSVRIIKYLIQQGAELNIVKKNYVLPFIVFPFIKKLLLCNNMTLLRLVLQHGAVPEDMELIAGTNRLRPSRRLPQSILPVPWHRRILHLANPPIYSPVTVALMRCNIKAYETLLYYGARNIVYYHQDINYDSSFSLYSMPIFIIFMHGENLEYPSGTEEDVIEALKIYQRFGGNLWATNGRGGYLQRYSSDPACPVYIESGETALDFLRRTEYLLESFPNLIPMLEKRMSKPLSLQKLCRIAVRDAMGTDMWKNVPQLPLPPAIKTFLKFKVDDETS